MSLQANPDCQHPDVGELALLACPFCGGAADIFNFGSSDIGDWWLAGCKACGIWLPSEATNPKREEAASAWNTRRQAEP